MDDPGQISEYGKILLMAMVGVLLVCATILLSVFLAPKNPNPVKLSTYECGEETTGSSWVQFNPRFYVIALIFLLFDVEIIFIFPWATIFGNPDLIAADGRWGWFTLIEMFIFIGILIIGLIYIWYRGDISWIKPRNQRPKVDVNIPSSAYDNLNAQSYPLRDFKVSLDVGGKDLSGLGRQAAEAPKLGFKPKFKQSNS